jgi:hypothetical protein
MAFGESWGVVRSSTESVRGMTTIPTGSHGDAYFERRVPTLARSTWYLIQVSRPFYWTIPFGV